MSISIKSPREIELMRISNHMLCDMHKELEKLIADKCDEIKKANQMNAWTD